MPFPFPRSRPAPGRRFPVPPVRPRRAFPSDRLRLPRRRPVPRPVPRPVSRPVPSPDSRPGLVACVSAEVPRDGAHGEFPRARRRILEWLAHRLGPLPEDFAPVLRPRCGAAPRSRRLERKGTMLRTREQSSPSGRSFGFSLEMGGDSSGADYRTEVTLMRNPGGCRVHTALRTLRERSAEEVRTVWVPGVVRRLAQSPGLVDYGWRVAPEPWIVSDPDGVRGLLELISEPRRTRPVFAVGLSGGETCPEAATVDVDDLAYRTAGIAHVAVITGPMTYVLTERVGRRFSVFGDALRTYRPGCALGRQEGQHPMALPATVRDWTPGGPPEFAAFLTREAARTSVHLQALRTARFEDANRRSH